MLNTETSADIEELVTEVIEISGKTYKAVEKALFDENIYPQGDDTHISDSDEYTDGNEWLGNTIRQILRDCNVKMIRITGN